MFHSGMETERDLDLTQWDLIMVVNTSAGKDSPHGSHPDLGDVRKKTSWGARFYLTKPRTVPILGS